MAPRKKPAKPNKTGREDVTMLQLYDIFAKRGTGGKEPIAGETKAAFLEAFELTCGNITASCQIAGISRMTYYRWIKGISDEDLEFQRRLDEIQPQERFLDMAELALMALVMSGDARAITFYLEKKGKSRNYDKPSTTDLELMSRAVSRTIFIIENHREKNPDYEPDIKRFASIAAKDFGVNAENVEKELEKRFSKAKKI